MLDWLFFFFFFLLIVCVFQCKMTISDVSAATMYDVLHDGVYRKTWDPAMLESFDIAQLSDNADVGYYSCKNCSACSFV